MRKNDYEIVVKKYQAAVLTLLFRLTGNRATAEDLCQDVFTKLWKKDIRIEAGRNIFTLIYKIANNTAIDHFRRNRETPIPLNESEFMQSVSAGDGQDVMEIVLNCLRYLKPKQRSAFVLRDIEGLMFSEISAILNMPENNVRSNLHLARKKVRNLFKTRYQLQESDFYEL